MKAIVWSKPACVYCEKAKSLLKMKGIEYEEKNIADGHKVQDLLEMVPNARTMPQIWLDEEHIGCLLYTSPSPRDRTRSRMPSSA